MQPEHARIIIKQIAEDTATELIARGIETEKDFDAVAEEIINKLMEKHYQQKLANLEY
jgi:hypothetical protein